MGISAERRLITGGTKHGDGGAPWVYPEKPGVIERKPTS